MYVRIRISILAQLRGYSQLDQSRHGYIYGTDRVPGEDANLCQLKSPRGATLPSAEKGKDKGNKWMAGGAEWLIVGNFFYRCFPEGGQPGHSAIDRVTYAYDRVAMYRTTGSQGPERPGRIHHRWDPVQAAASTSVPGPGRPPPGLSTVVHKSNVPLMTVWQRCQPFG